MIIGIRKYTMYIIFALALLLASCATPGAEQSQQGPVKLKIGIRPFLSYAPLFIAEEEGYFAEQGLEVEFVKVSGTAEAVPSLADGQLDIIAGTIGVGMLNAMARGTNIKLVADKGYLSRTDCTYATLMARRSLVEDGELDGPTQLQGRRIAMTASTSSGYYVEKLLETANLTLDAVEIKDIPIPVHLDALEKGTIDLAYSGEPWVTRIEQSGLAIVWMPAQQVIPDFQFAFILYGPALLEQNPEAGRRFMAAYLKAVQQYNQGKTERNLEILAKYTELDPKLLEQACWLAIRNDGQIDVESVLDFQRWALEKKFVDQLVAEEQFWDPSFVEYTDQKITSDQ